MQMNGRKFLAIWTIQAPVSISWLNLPCMRPGFTLYWPLLWGFLPVRLSQGPSLVWRLRHYKSLRGQSLGRSESLHSCNRCMQIPKDTCLILSHSKDLMTIWIKLKTTKTVASQSFCVFGISEGNGHLHCSSSNRYLNASCQLTYLLLAQSLRAVLLLGDGCTSFASWRTWENWTLKQMSLIKAQLGCATIVKTSISLMINMVTYIQYLPTYIDTIHT